MKGPFFRYAPLASLPAPAFADAFTAGPTLLRFTRAADGRIVGFAVSMGRARNIAFVRRAR